MQDIRRIADMLDTKFKLPNGWRFGWDGILGLIPGVGDAITDAFSFYIVFRAALMGYPPSIIMRMIINIAIDNIVDKVPVLGFLFDFMWKSNTKNVALMDRYTADPDRTRKASIVMIVFTVFFIVALYLLCLAATIYAAYWLFKKFFPDETYI